MMTELRYFPGRFPATAPRMVFAAALAFVCMFCIFRAGDARARFEPIYSASQSGDIADTHNLWFLPGAEIINADYDGAGNVTVTVRYEPLNPLRMFQSYISSDPDVITGLLGTEEELTLSAEAADGFVDLGIEPPPGGAATPGGNTGGMTFYVVKEGTDACVYASGPNRQGVAQWRVRRSIDTAALLDGTDMCSAFDGAPATCGEVEACMIPCQGPDCIPGDCCMRYGSVSDSREHCVPAQTEEPEGGKVDVGAVTSLNIIPDECWTGDMPPESNLRDSYPKYRSLLGQTVYCIEESVTNLLLSDGSVFETVREAMKGTVMLVMTLGIIVFAYPFLTGKKRGMRDLVAVRWIILKLIMVNYFAVGPGMNMVLDNGWTAMKAFSGAILAAGTGTATSAGPVASPPDTADAPAAELQAAEDNLIQTAEDYSRLVQSARNAVAFHDMKENEFDRKSARVREMCADISPGANRGSLFNAPENSKLFMTEEAAALLREGTYRNLMHCNIEANCVLRKNGEDYSWQAARSDIAALMPQNILREEDKKRTCEQEVLERYIPAGAKNEDIYRITHGGELGGAYRDLKREASKLMDAYNRYYEAVKLINNHNLLIYYYRQLADKDREFEVVKDNLSTLNDSIATLEKELDETNAELDEASAQIINDCTGAPDMEEALARKSAAEAEVDRLEAEQQSLERQMSTVHTRFAGDNDRINAETQRLRGELEDIEQDIQEQREIILLATNELEQNGCIQIPAEDLAQLQGERDELEQQLNDLKSQKAMVTNDDYVIQLRMKDVIARFESRLAFVRQRFPEYYSEFYCALTTVSDTPRPSPFTDFYTLLQGQLEKLQYVQCPLTDSNPRVICLDRHLFLLYSSLLDTANENFSLVNEIRHQCEAIAQDGTLVGEGYDNSSAPPADIQISQVLNDFYEVHDYAVQQLYSAAASVCWLGGKVHNIDELIVTIPPGELLGQESPSIAENDTAMYSSSDVGTKVNPYIRFADGQVPFTVSRRLAVTSQTARDALAKLGGESIAFEDLESGEDCDGEVDRAFFKYCTVLHGANTGETLSEEYDFEYSGEGSDGMKAFGIHGCEKYFEDYDTDGIPTAGLLDYMSEANDLCPEQTDNGIAYAVHHTWDFPQRVLATGAGLDGSRRRYYTCKAPGGGGAPAGTDGLDATLPDAYDRLVDLFGAEDNAPIRKNACDARVIEKCVEEGLDYDECSTRLGITGVPGNDIDKGFAALLKAKYDYEQKKKEESTGGDVFSAMGFAADEAGMPGSAGGGAPFRTAAQNFTFEIPTDGLYDYCGNIAAEGDGSFLLWDILDCKLMRYLGVGAGSSTGSVGGDIFSFMSSDQMPKLLVLVFFFGLVPVGWVAYPLGMLALVLLFRICMRVATYYIGAMITVVALVFMAPVFIPMVLFNATKDIFDGWLTNLLGAFLQPLILAASYTAIFYVLDIGYFGGNFEFEANNDISKPDRCAGGASGVIAMGYCDIMTVGAQVDAAWMAVFFGIIPIAGFLPDPTGAFFAIGLARFIVMLFVAGLLIDYVEKFAPNVAQVYRAGSSPGVNIAMGSGSQRSMSSEAGAASKARLTGNKWLRDREKKYMARPFARILRPLGAPVSGRGFEKDEKGVWGRESADELPDSLKEPPGAFWRWLKKNK